MALPPGAPGSDPRYDDVELYSLRHDHLLPGDVILMRNRFAHTVKDNKRSGTIALITRGRFSHAAICTLPPTAIEAVPDGVANFTLASTFFHDRANVRVLRYPHAAVAARAAEKASEFLGMGYSVPLAIRSAFPGLAGHAGPRPKTFCSALVAAAFAAGGAPEFARRNPFSVKPATLERMKVFSDITTDVTRMFKAHTNMEEMGALDGDRRQSMLASHTAAYREIYQAIVEDIEALIDHWGLKTDRPNNFFEALHLVTGNINHCLAHPEAEYDTFRNDAGVLDAKLHLLMVAGGLDRTLALAIDDDSDRMEELQFRAQLSEPGLDLEDLEALLFNSYGQIEARSESIAPPRCPPGASLSWDLWHSITQRSIQHFEKRLAGLEAALARLAPERLESVRARRLQRGTDRPV